MKLIKTIATIIPLVLIISTPPTFAQSSAGKNLVPDSELGLRKLDLFDEQKVTGAKTEYSKEQPGQSKKFERSFENAPPLIPHSIADFPEISKDINICTTCHLPAVAPAMKSTAIPASHFASFQPVKMLNDKGELVYDSKTISNTTDVLTVTHKKENLSNERYNCTSCHVPQSNNDPLVKNTFEAKFTADGKTSSNLLDVLNEGVK